MLVNADLDDDGFVTVEPAKKKTAEKTRRNARPAEDFRTVATTSTYRPQVSHGLRSGFAKNLIVAIMEGVFPEEPAEEDAHACVLEHIDEIADKFIGEVKRAANAGARAKLFEYAVANYFWELLSHEKVVVYLDEWFQIGNKESQEGDGHTVFHWLGWPSVWKRPAPGLTRVPEDELKTAELLFNKGFDVFAINKKGETVLASLEQSSKVAYIPEDFYVALRDFCIRSQTSDKTIAKITKQLLGKIAPASVLALRTKICWIMAVRPEVFARELVLSLPGCIAELRDCYSDLVHLKITTLISALKAGPDSTDSLFADFSHELAGWNADAMIARLYVAIRDAALAAPLDNLYSSAYLGESKDEDAQREAEILWLTDPDTVVKALVTIRHREFLSKATATKLNSVLAECEQREIYAVADLLQFFLGRKVDTKSISELLVSIPASGLRPVCVLEQKVAQSLNVTQVVSKLGFLGKLDKFVPSEEAFVVCGNGSLRDELLDDCLLGLEKTIKSGQVPADMLVTAVILKTVDAVTKQSQIPASVFLVEQLIKKELLEVKSVTSALRDLEGLDDITELVDNPRMVGAVVDLFAQTFGSSETAKPVEKEVVTVVLRKGKGNRRRARKSQ